jgi:site-specific recombinase XerD
MENLPATIEHQNLVTIADNRADQQPAVVYLASLSAGSRRTMAQSLSTMANILTGDETVTYLDIPWQQLRFQHTAALRASLLNEQFSYATINKMLSALRGTLKAAWKLGLLSGEDYHKAASVESIKGETVPAGRAIAAGELVGLLDTCDNTVLGIRDAAVISLLYGCGLRRAEVVSLDLADYRAQEETLRVKGKRNKQRLIPLVGGAANALADWLAVRSDLAGPLFWGVGNRNNGRRLTTQAIYNMLQKRAVKGGMDRLSPHDFRRTFVGDLLDRGADIVTVQKLAGHANVETTARYDRRGEKAKHKAAKLLHVPHKKRRLSVGA